MSYGANSFALSTSGLVIFLPTSLFTPNMVLLGFTTACLLATAPANLLPSSVKATTDGVILLPSSFGITTGLPPSIIETHELVVPRSIPTMGIITSPN